MPNFIDNILHPQQTRRRRREQRQANQQYNVEDIDPVPPYPPQPPRYSQIGFPSLQSRQQARPLPATSDSRLSQVPSMPIFRRFSPHPSHYSSKP